MCSLFVLLFTQVVLSQQGLEKIIVEKYYISNALDTAANYYAGKLPVNSTTYRIYVDMLPGYKFQAAYGSPEHTLKMNTTTHFFNNTDHGATIANTIPYRTLKKNTVMLDSWISVGSAGEDCVGILKTEDDTIATINHEKKFLRNENKVMGESLLKKDGLIHNGKAPRPMFFNLDSAASVFAGYKNGNSFIVNNGAWACLGGTYGIDSLKTNRVLIAQITTDGDFSFELNIQIGTPKNGVSQKYVARNPIGDEICIPSLIYIDKKKIEPQTIKK